MILSLRFRSKQSSSGSSSIGVIRTDSDVFEGILFDGDSRGSSVSLNSTCSARSHQDPILSNGLHDETNLNLNGYVDHSFPRCMPLRILCSSFTCCRNNWIHSQDSNNSIECLSNDSGTNVLNWSPQFQKRFEANCSKFLSMFQIHCLLSEQVRCWCHSRDRIIAMVISDSV